MIFRSLDMLRIQFKRFVHSSPKTKKKTTKKPRKEKKKKQKKSHQLNVFPYAFAHNSESNDQTDIKGCSVYFTSPVLSHQAKARDMLKRHI